MVYRPQRSRRFTLQSHAYHGQLDIGHERCVCVFQIDGGRLLQDIMESNCSRLGGDQLEVRWNSEEQQTRTGPGADREREQCRIKAQLDLKVSQSLRLRPGLTRARGKTSRQRQHIVPVYLFVVYICMKN